MISRQLPGIPLKDSQGKIDYRRGIVAQASERMVFVDLEHPDPANKRVFLMGESYIYWCPRCDRTVYEHDVTAFGSVVQGGPRGTTNIRICPFCAKWGPDGRPTGGTPLSFVKVGQRLKMHYRFGQQVPPCTCTHRHVDHVNKVGHCQFFACACERYLADEAAEPSMTGEWWAEIVR